MRQVSFPCAEDNKIKKSTQTVKKIYTVIYSAGTNKVHHTSPFHVYTRHSIQLTFGYENELYNMEPRHYSCLEVFCKNCLQRDYFHNCHTLCIKDTIGTKS